MAMYKALRYLLKDLIIVFQKRLLTYTSTTPLLFFVGANLSVQNKMLNPSIVHVVLVALPLVHYYRYFLESYILN